MKTTRKLTANETGFWPKWFGKLLFTVISVKVWGLIAGTAISTWLLMIHQTHTPIVVGDKIIEYGINGAQWVTFNTTIWALIFGMKEIFRITEQQDYSDQVMQRTNLEHKTRIAGILSGNESNQTCSEFEEVGHDPEEI